jgi:glycosyltransferase involved in cell wall biosynthesis
MPSVALVSRSNAVGGGASRIAEELAEWLLAAGSRVVHFCGSPVGASKPFQATLHSPGFPGKLSRGVHRLTRRLGLNEFIPLEFYSTLRHVLNEFDVVHFHDLNLAIAPFTVQLCSRKKPVVFTAHDCSCFTGGCVYPLKCEGYLARCGNCPQLPAVGARFDFTPSNLGINRWLASQATIQYVFPSRWLRERASRSLHFAKPAEVIPNGFSPAGYEFGSKSDARRELGIRDETKVILVAAHYLADPRKGVAFALAAIKAVADLNPLVIFVGNPPSDLEARMLGMRFWLAGFVSDKRRLGLLFAASDVFVFSSLEDNLPIMVQEAMAAGTPVVGFAAGGVPEMVDDQRTGWLCPPGDQLGLNVKLRDALTDGNLSEFGRAARESVRERFDIDAFGKRHLELYEEVAK